MASSVGGKAKAAGGRVAAGAAGAPAAAAAGGAPGGGGEEGKASQYTGVHECVRVVGLPLSTFTRTLVMALRLKNVLVQQVAAGPHSDAAKAHHPYGRIPSVGFWYDLKTRELAALKPPQEPKAYPDASAGEKPVREPDFWLFESQAVAGFIDTHFSSFSVPALHDSSNAVRNALIHQWMSAAADYLFNAIEHGVIKPRLAFIEAKGLDAARAVAGTADDPLAAAIKKANEFLVPFEQLAAATTPAAPYLMGSRTVSWVDLFVLPILADLQATVDAPHMLSSTCHPHLYRWLTQTMFALDVVVRTYDGSLAHTLGVEQRPAAAALAPAAPVIAAAAAAGAGGAIPIGAKRTGAQKA